MDKERSKRIRRRLGPIGLSLLASALTAAGFAAFSIADSGGGNGGGTAQSLPAPPPGGRGAIAFAPRLSAEDRQKMEAFQQCMQDNGAPGPPSVDPSQGPPKPPSAEEQQKIQKAYEACKDKLPEDLQNAGPPHLGACGPPPGAPAPNRGSNQNQDQSNQSGGQSSGSSS